MEGHLGKPGINLNCVISASLLSESARPDEQIETESYGTDALRLYPEACHDADAMASGDLAAEDWLLPQRCQILL